MVKASPHLKLPCELLIPGNSLFLLTCIDAGLEEPKGLTSVPLHVVCKAEEPATCVPSNGTGKGVC